MGFQISSIQVTGKIGDLIGYEVKGKIRTRSKAKNYKLSEGSKKTSKEFGIASTAGRLIRLGLAPMIDKMSDRAFTNQLNKRLREVVATGPGEKGSRQVADGDLALLRGLQLNLYTRFDRLFSVSPLIAVDEMGTLNITLPECETVLAMQHHPAWTKEAVIKVIVCTLDFATGNGKVATSDDLIINLKEPVSYESALELPLDVLEDRAIVTAVAIFFKGDEFLSGDRNYFAAEILDACLVRDGKVVPFIYPGPVKPPVDEPRKAVQRIAWKIKKPSSDDPQPPSETP